MSVSYEQVARVADELKRNGQRASVREVYARVGGDYTMVQKHMRTWRQQEVPESGPAAAELSAALQNALRQEIAQQRREAVLTASAELKEVGEEVEDLTRETGRLTSELETATTSLRAVEIENQGLTTEAAQLRGQAEKLQERLDEALAAADRVRVELAQVRLQSTGDATLIETLQRDVEARRAEIENERASRVASDRSLAAATAALEAQQARATDLVARVQLLESDRTALQKGLDSERSLRHTVERDRDVALERTAAALARAEDLAARERELRVARWK